MSTSLGGSRGYGPTGAGQQKKVAGYNVASLNRFSPEQMDLFNRLLAGSRGGIEAGLANLSGLAAGDQSQFEQMEAPALRQFGALQGQLASRFSGMGTGARKSSGFGLATSSAAQEFAERLQGQRMGLQQQAIRDLLGMQRDLLGAQPYEQFLVPPKKKGWESFLGAGLPIAGAALGGLFGGPAGAFMGGSLGGSAGSAFL